MERGTLPASEIRDLLGQIEGIASVDVRQGPMGEIEALEIAVRPGAVERRVVRNVESALMSGLGVRIDHQAIEIRPAPNGAPEQERADHPMLMRDEENGPKSLSA